MKSASQFLVLSIIAIIFLSGCVQQYSQRTGSYDSNCEKPVFTEFIVDPKYVSHLGQIGTVHGSGQFMVSRSYVYVDDEFSSQKIPIYAPTKMVLSRGAYYQISDIPDYALYFDAGCNVEFVLAHLKETVPSVAKQFSAPKQDSRTEELDPVEFEAGELIGYFVFNPGGVSAFDIIAYDSSVTNTFANNARFEFGYGSQDLLNGVCPYDFYTGEMKDAYYKLLGGSCGQSSRDFPGTISGNWFLDKEVTRWAYDYYKNGIYGSLLAIAGDYDRIVIGTIGDRATTFIYPDFPTYKDPKDVTDEHCYQIHPNHNPAQWDGYIFFQLVDNETLKVFYSANGECPQNFPETGWQIYYR